MAIRQIKPASGEISLDLGRANPKQAQFYYSKALYTAYGGARGGGKTHAVRIKALLGALHYPGIKILIVRRTYPELQSNHIEPMLKLIPPSLADYAATQKTFRFINGSMVRFGHYQTAEAEQEYQGQEFDWIFLDEATQFSEEEFRVLGACLRGVNDIPKRFYLTCNPGGIGHKWVKRLFIDRDYKHGSSPEERENPDDYVFIPATVDDNTALLNSPGGEAYKRMLSSLPERLRQAHRYGDWDALGGSYFSELRRDEHTFSPFRIPGHWRRYRAFDYGLDMFACLWIAVDEEGRAYVYRECLRENLVVSKAAEEMIGLTLPKEKIEATFAPPDMWARRGNTGRDLAGEFLRCGVPIIKADNGRAQGHILIKEGFLPLKGGKPGLLISESCPRLWGDLTAIQADELNPCDCAVTPHDVTHSVDALRYFCSMRLAKTEGEERGYYTDFILS